MTGQADLLDEIEAATNRCSNRENAMRLRWLRHLRLVARRGTVNAPRLPVQAAPTDVDNTDPWWASCARRAIETLAQTGRPFTADDVHDLGVPAPDHPNRWGRAFRNARVDGVIEAIGFIESRREQRKAGVVRVWRGVA